MLFYPYYSMIAEINQLVLKVSDLFIIIIIALILYVVISLILSKKGGIPRSRGKILSKNEFIVLIVILFLVSMVIKFLLMNLINSLYIQYVEFVLPLMIFLIGLAFLTLDKQMKWKFNKHGYWCIGIGIAWGLLECGF